MSAQEGETVGQRIRRLRLEQGLSQQAISTEGVAQNAYISHIESGRRQPGLDVLVSIAQKLGVSALYLLTGDDGPCPLCGRGEHNNDPEPEPYDPVGEGIMNSWADEAAEPES